jgi:release factor glutamine methyltransferase
VNFEAVYEPAEDSFLLLDALEKDIKLIRERIPLLCVEIGSGSGIISTALAASIKSAFIIACDINREACLATKKTAQLNKVSQKLDVVHIDFFQGLLFKNNVDILVCNPPYVATDDNETGHDDVRAAWAGGGLGRDLTDRLVQQLPQILSAQGLAYIVLEQCNKPDDVLLFANSLPHLEAEFVLKRRAGRELLYVLKLWLSISK